MSMDLVFVLKWVKSVIACTLYIFHLSGFNKLEENRRLEDLAMGSRIQLKLIPSTK